MYSVLAWGSLRRLKRTRGLLPPLRLRESSNSGKKGCRSIRWGRDTGTRWQRFIRGTRHTSLFYGRAIVRDPDKRASWSCREIEEAGQAPLLHPSIVSLPRKHVAECTVVISGSVCARLLLLPPFFPLDRLRISRSIGVFGVWALCDGTRRMQTPRHVPLSCKCRGESVSFLGQSKADTRTQRWPALARGRPLRRQPYPHYIIVLFQVRTPEPRWCTCGKAQAAVAGVSGKQGVTDTGWPLLSTYA